MQKIFLKDKQLIFCNAEEAVNLQVANPDLQFYEYQTETIFRELIAKLPETASKGLIISYTDIHYLQELFYSIYIPVPAGGGVVFNEENELLMIFRKGKWDLPKGKLDEGEDMEHCALREVIEETGIQQLTIGEKIGETFHAYSQKKQLLLKCSSWYFMKSIKNQVMAPQLEEEILEVRWVNKNDIAELLANTYPAIIEVLKMARFIS